MGSSSREVSDLLPPHILRFLLLHREPHRVIDFVPDGDTVPIMYDTYDKFAQNYFKDNTDDFARAFFVSHIPTEQKHLEPKTLPRFSQIAFLVQMPHLDTAVEVEKIEEKTLTSAEKIELGERSEYAKKWLSLYAPEDYRYEIKKTLPEDAKLFSELQKKALADLAGFVESKSELNGQDLHTRLHEMKSELEIEPKALFEAIYVSILGKKSGPKAGWFLSVLDKDFLIKRLKEASK
jgi:lysyl-tRNA synthetase class 1